MKSENEKSTGFDSRAIPCDQLATAREIFLFYLPSHPQLYGLKRTMGIWEVVDKERFNLMEEPTRTWVREFLNAEFKAGRFKKEVKE